MIWYLVFNALFRFVFTLTGATGIDEITKINGVSFVGPINPITSESLLTITKVNADWIAVLPYGYAYPDKPEIFNDYPMQWWGEKKEGVVSIMQFARDHKLKIMLKPDVWIIRGWTGNFNLDSEESWKKWENEYTRFIIPFAIMADSMDVEIFCIGTEYKVAATKRPEYWESLIDSVRSIYKGKLTYAANWDEFEEISFWNKVDFIGINAYFPLSTEQTPSTETLLKAWEIPFNKIKIVQSNAKKPILFTEYGYRSVSQTTWEQWNLNKDEFVINYMSQYNAYEALFKCFWNQHWFAGGFLWQWYHSGNEEGRYDKDFTPQNKPAMELIKKWYSHPND